MRRRGTCEDIGGGEVAPLCGGVKLPPRRRRGEEVEVKRGEVKGEVGNR